MKPINETLQIYQQLAEHGQLQTEEQLKEANRQFSMSTEKSSATAKPMVRHFDLLWSRLSEIYGHKLTSSYGDSLPQTWQDALAMMPTEKIKTALSACMTSGDPWPPSLPEFLAMCEGGKLEGWEHNTAAYKTIPRSHRLEQPRDEKKAQSALAEMKESLGVKANSGEPDDEPESDFDAETDLTDMLNQELTPAEKQRRQELIDQAEMMAGQDAA